MLLIFSRLALLPHDFDFKQTQEILFDFFPRDEDEIGKIFFLPHTGAEYCRGGEGFTAQNVLSSRCLTKR